MPVQLLPISARGAVSTIRRRQSQFVRSIRYGETQRPAATNCRSLDLRLGRHTDAAVATMTPVSGCAYQFARGRSPPPACVGAAGCGPILGSTQPETVRTAQSSPSRFARWTKRPCKYRNTQNITAAPPRERQTRVGRGHKGHRSICHKTRFARGSAKKSRPAAGDCAAARTRPVHGQHKSIVRRHRGAPRAASEGAHQHTRPCCQIQEYQCSALTCTLAGPSLLPVNSRRRSRW